MDPKTIVYCIMAVGGALLITPVLLRLFRRRPPLISIEELARQLPNAPLPEVVYGQELFRVARETMGGDWYRIPPFYFHGM